MLHIHFASWVLAIVDQLKKMGVSFFSCMDDCFASLTYGDLYAVEIHMGLRFNETDGISIDINEIGTFTAECAEKHFNKSL